MGQTLDSALEARYEKYREILKGLTLMSGMCAEMEKLYSEGRTDGRIEGKIEGRIEGRMEQAQEMSLSLAGMGIPVEKIAEAAKVSVKLVQEWLAGGVSMAK